MSIEIWLQLLGWSTLVNWGILLVWFAFFALARDWMRRLHGRWFQISAEQFDAIHYAGMAAYKTLILVFNLVPYLVLRAIS
jgi:hypothetical protein